MVIKIIHYSTNFIRKWHKLTVSEKKQIKKKISIFQNNPFIPTLKTHKLRGKLSGYWSFSLDYKNRILFSFKKQREVLFYDFGGHEIYK